MEQSKKFISKKFSIILLIISILSGVGGAFFLGHILDQVARSIFGLTTWDVQGLMLQSVLLMLLMGIGTSVIIGGVMTENKKLRWAIIAFSVPIPIVIEIIDVCVRMVFIIQDAYAFYGLN